MSQSQPQLKLTVRQLLRQTAYAVAQDFRSHGYSEDEAVENMVPQGSFIFKNDDLTHFLAEISRAFRDALPENKTSNPPKPFPLTPRA